MSTHVCKICHGPTRYEAGMCANCRDELFDKMARQFSFDLIREIGRK